MHKPAAPFFLLAFLVGTCWNELSHWKTPFLERELLYRSSCGAIRMIGRLSLLWLVNQGGFQFLQKVYSMLESKLLRTYLALRGSIKPWCKVLGRSYYHGCCCCCAVCYQMRVELELGDMTKCRTLAEGGQECSGWKDRAYFLHLCWK